MKSEREKKQVAAAPSENEKKQEAAVLSENEKKHKKCRRKERTPEQKKKIRIKALIILGSILGVLALFIGAVALTGFLGSKTNLKKIDAYEAVGHELVPEIDQETGYWTFTTDRDFKVLQITDIHIGGGAFSLQKDAWAIDAVYTLIKRTKPDLVIATGDIAYPAGFQSGSFNNLREAEIFATLMEKCDVYWALVFGNHDTESYSMYNRKEISDFYSENRWAHCLFQTGPTSKVDGYGNYVVNVKNSSNIITHSMFLFDSHAYPEGDSLGAAWKYDNIHQNQVNWYEEETLRLDAINAGRGGGKILSTAYFHIPLPEYKTAWSAYVDNGNKDTEDVKYVYGVAGETGKIVYCGIGDDNLFEKMAELKNTVGIFCGHDHLNNFSVEYKGIKLTYGLSIDYLAYYGIVKKTSQRGGTVITVKTDGTIQIAQERLVA